MRSLNVVVVHEQHKPILDGSLTVYSRVMETVDPHFERVRPLFDQVSVDIVELTPQI